MPSSRRNESARTRASRAEDRTGHVSCPKLPADPLIHVACAPEVAEETDPLGEGWRGEIQTAGGQDEKEGERIREMAKELCKP